ncbi:MAG: MBL fold metallo-hydrolase [Bacilli bacterium]|nr:MBL fold metallo-hydrolase [Bacilli bacterium]
MKIETIVTGVLEENCYVLKKNNTCLVVDPGDDYDKIKDVIGDDKVLGVLITHSHFDHIGALRNFLTKRNTKIFKKSSVEEKEYNIGDFTFEVIFTPGHSKDSITFYFKEDNIMFVGDFIFKESIGRCDLPGGDINEMNESLDRIKKYPKETVLYPGHYDSTTLEYEINNNSYM